MTFKSITVSANFNSTDFNPIDENKLLVVNQILLFLELEATNLKIKSTLSGGGRFDTFDPSSCENVRTRG